MNENPNQEAIRPPEIPAEAPNNPYRARTGELTGANGTPHDRRAKGLDGDMLDSLLKSRMVEGMQLGHEDGYQAAAKAYPNIFDEVWRRGVGEGYQMGLSGAASLLAPLHENVGKAQAMLMQIAAKAKKGSFTERSAEVALDALREGLK